MQSYLVLLLASLSAAGAADTASHSTPVIEKTTGSLPELEQQEEVGECNINNDTCTVAPDASVTLLAELLEIHDKQQRREFIESNGIKVEHSFLNDVSERFLYIENYHTPSDFIVGEVGATTSFLSDEQFLTLQPKECPADKTNGPCFTIEHANGQLYAMPFRDRPYIFAFDNENSVDDALTEGIVVFDSTRFERVLESGLWVLEDRGQTVSIRNVGTGRRLFAKDGYDKNTQFGGSTGKDNEPINNDQKWRHCARYTHGEENRIDCSRYI